MSWIDICIRRPVLTWMMMLALLVFGVLGYNRLGVDQFPSMEFPVVVVTAVLEGANPEVMEEDVTEVLEEYINSVPGLRNLLSTTFHGVTSITAEFELGVDIEVAVQDVRDQIARARRTLPRDVEPPTVERMNPGNFPVIWIPITSDRGAVASTEYVKDHIKPHMETIPGVAGIDFFGRRERNIRIWLDGEALRARGLAATDVIDAIRREHVEIPGGKVEGKRIDYSVKTDAEFDTLEGLERLVVARRDGVRVLLRDVARVEDGAEDPHMLARFNGLPATGIGLRKQSQANTVAIADASYLRLEQLRPGVPAGFDFPSKDGLIDFSVAIREAVDETQFALVFGALLATLVVWGFLRRIRPTLIVGAAIPLSLVPTFGIMWLAGFTLNTMTLLALALAVGVVIDDAIVVLENIERHREQGERPVEAASRGAREIAFAATAATVSIAAVFLPVAAVEGIVGNFLKEFGVTVGSAVMVSLFVALTLTPMLAARMGPPAKRSHGSIYHRLEQGMDWLESSYRRVLTWALSHRAATLGIAVASLALAVFFGRSIGGEFFPAEDRGRIMVSIETPPGTSLDATEDVLKHGEQWMLEQPELAGLFSAIGVGGPGQPGSSSRAIMFAVLKSRHERERSAQQLITAARGALGAIPGQKVTVYDMSQMVGGGTRGADFEYYLKGNLDLAELDRISTAVVRELEQREGMVAVRKSLELGLPEVRVIPDREKAAALGVDAASLATVVQAMIGGLDVATFKEAGQRYDIRMRLEQEARATPASIERLYARSADGHVVELRNLVRIESGAAPSTITRHNRERAVSIYGNLENKALGEALDEAMSVAARIVPENVSIELTGAAESFRESVGQFGLALLLGVLVIYMVLAAQFESFVHPLTVMLALPLAMVGALGGLWTLSWFRPGMTLNLFSMIGFILLLGLVTKNSILLVDYANQLRAQGLDKLEAVRQAAPVRMRPVLMTAFSMIFGVLPAAVGVGPGAESRSPMAVATGAGMLSSTLLTLLVVPVFYLVLDDAVVWLRRVPARLIGRAASEAQPASRSASDRSK